MPRSTPILLIVMILTGAASVSTTAPSPQPADFDRLWDYNDPVASEAKFRALLPDAERSGDVGYRIELLTQIARTHSLRRQFDQSHALLDEAQKLLGDEESKLPRARVRYLLERGRAFNSAGKPQEARPLFERAMDLAAAKKLDGYAVDAAHMIAIVEPDPQGQLDWNRKAIAMAEASADPSARRWLASLYNNLGCTLHDLKRFDEALPVFEKAMEYRAAADPPQPRELRVAKYAVGRALRALNRTDEALAMQWSVHAECVAANDVDPYVCEELAELLTTKGDHAEAAKFAKVAYEGLSKDEWFVQNEPARLERMKQIAR
jgi:tetratricopeptide (TPR) repeat protein